VYEAVYGASHEVVPPARANPIPLILPAAEMLRDLGEGPTAERMVNAVSAVLLEGRTKPADLGGAAGTAEFTEAVVEKL